MGCAAVLSEDFMLLIKNAFLKFQTEMMNVGKMSTIICTALKVS